MQLGMDDIPTWSAAFQVESYTDCFFSMAADENVNTGYMSLKCVIYKVHHAIQKDCIADFCTLCVTERCVKTRQDLK